MLEGVRDDTSVLGACIFQTHHRVGLATTSLSIGKDRTVITLKDRFDERKGAFIVHGSLRGVPIIYSIIGEGFLLSCISSIKDYLIYFLVNFNTKLAT